MKIRVRHTIDLKRLQADLEELLKNDSIGGGDHLCFCYRRRMQKEGGHCQGDMMERYQALLDSIMIS